MINTGVKRKKEKDLFELGIHLSSVHTLKLVIGSRCYKKWDKGGEGSGGNEIFLSLGM